MKKELSAGGACPEAMAGKCHYDCGINGLPPCSLRYWFPASPSPENGTPRTYLLTYPVPIEALAQICEQLEEQGWEVVSTNFLAHAQVKRAVVSPSQQSQTGTAMYVVLARRPKPNNGSPVTAPVLNVTL